MFFSPCVPIFSRLSTIYSFILTSWFTFNCICYVCSVALSTTFTTTYKAILSFTSILFERVCLLFKKLFNVLPDFSTTLILQLLFFISNIYIISNKYIALHHNYFGNNRFDWMTHQMNRINYNAVFMYSSLSN